MDFIELKALYLPVSDRIQDFMVFFQEFAKKENFELFLV